MRRILPSLLVALSITLMYTPAAQPVQMKRYIIKVDPNYRSIIENAYVKAGGKVTNRFSQIFSGFVVELPSLPNLTQLLTRRIQLIEEDALIQISQTTQSNPTWALDRIDQRSLPLSNSYTYVNGGSGSTIYIIDTGIADHDDFGERVSNVGYTNVSDGLGFRDCNGHGTHVASLAAGTTYGVAKNATLVSVRVFSCAGSTSVSNVLAGLNWILGGSNTNSKRQAVVNMSLGGSISASLDAAVASLVDAGIPVVVAAGNDNLDACNYSPSREPKAITVGATGSNDSKAWFSNYGSCIDINAPGLSILGADTPTATATVTKSGTSMASPIVAGIVANYLGFEPAATPTMVSAFLTQKATTNVLSGLTNGTVNRLVFAPPDDNPIQLAASVISLSRSETATITFTAGQNGTVNFLSNGRFIKNCRNLSTSNEVASCTFRPSRHGNNIIEARITPTGQSISSTTRKSISVTVARRTGN